VRVQIFIRCQSCFAKFQHGRYDIAFTHKVTPVR